MNQSVIESKRDEAQLSPTYKPSVSEWRRYGNAAAAGLLILVALSGCLATEEDMAGESAGSDLTLSGPPIGYFDLLEYTTPDSSRPWYRGLRFAGWALDPDKTLCGITDPVKCGIRVDFYLDGPAGSGMGIGSTIANLASPDVTNVTHYPGNHRFDVSFPPNFGNQPTFLNACSSHRIYAYAIGIKANGGEDQHNLLLLKDIGSAYPNCALPPPK